MVTAAVGESALGGVESEEPDLVLLDVVMPELDGYAVCRRLRAPRRDCDAAGDHGHGERGGECKAIEAGADDSSRSRSTRRAACPGKIAASDQALPRHRQDAGRRLLELNRISKDASAAVPASSGCGSCDGSSRPARRRHRLVRRRLDPVQPPPQVAMFFADLRGWTTFVEAVEPEELMQVPGEFHGRRRGRSAVRCHRGLSWATGSNSSSTTPPRSPTPPFGRCGWAAHCGKRWRS